MPVSLFTGLLGAGKTASLVKRMIDLQKKEPGRPIFQFGINGLKDGIAIPLTEEMLHKWWELPQGSIICIDECQEDGTAPDQPVSLMPKDRGNPAPWIQHMTKCRHYGIDFLLTTQHPANMSAYVRRLVGYHLHSVMRAKGVRQTYVWNRCIDDPDNRRDKKTGEMSISPLPKEVFDLYKSSSLHTMKVRTPRIVYLAAALALLAVFLAFYIPHRIHKTIHPDAATTVGADSKGAADALRVADFAKWSRPRVSGIPWTAPMFDKLEVKAQPRLYCIAVDDGSCSCITEQGTNYVVEPKTCRAVAANGLYNPFIEPPGEDQTKKSSQDSAGRRSAPSAPAGRQIAASDDGSSSDSIPGANRQISNAYTPPGYGPWDSTPLLGAN